MPKRGEKPPGQEPPPTVGPKEAPVRGPTTETLEKGEPPPLPEQNGNTPPPIKATPEAEVPNDPIAAANSAEQQQKMQSLQELTGFSQVLPKEAIEDLHTAMAPPPGTAAPQPKSQPTAADPATQALRAKQPHIYATDPSGRENVAMIISSTDGTYHVMMPQQGMHDPNRAYSTAVEAQTAARNAFEKAGWKVSFDPRKPPPGSTAPPPVSEPVFTPSREWQDVPDWAAIPPGGIYRVNMETGARQARWEGTVPGPEKVFDQRTGKYQTGGGGVAPARRAGSVDTPVMSRTELEAAVARFRRTYAGSAPIEVVGGAHELPTNVRADLHAQGQHENISAFVHSHPETGERIYVTADRQHSLANLTGDLMEEAVGHSGVRSILPPEEMQTLVRAIDKRFSNDRSYLRLQRQGYEKTQALPWPGGEQ
jgi:hypothetical protein